MGRRGGAVVAAYAEARGIAAAVDHVQIAARAGREIGHRLNPAGLPIGKTNACNEAGVENRRRYVRSGDSRERSDIRLLRAGIDEGPRTIGPLYAKLVVGCSN